MKKIIKLAHPSFTGNDKEEGGLTPPHSIHFTTYCIKKDKTILPSDSSSLSKRIASHVRLLLLWHWPDHDGDPSKQYPSLSPWNTARQDRQLQKAPLSAFRQEMAAGAPGPTPISNTSISTVK